MAREWCTRYSVRLVHTTLWHANGAHHVMAREWCTRYSTHIAPARSFAFITVSGKTAKQSLCKPGGFQEVEAPRLPDSRHTKVVGLSALRTGRLYPLISVTG